MPNRRRRRSTKNYDTMAARMKIKELALRQQELEQERAAAGTHTKRARELAMVVNAQLERCEGHCGAVSRLNSRVRASEATMTRVFAVVTVLACALLTWPPYRSVPPFISGANTVVALLFTLEAATKILTFKGQYFLNLWDLTDFVATTVDLLALLLDFAFNHKFYFSAQLHAVRILRLARVASLFSELQIILASIGKAFHRVLSVLVVYLVFLLVCAMLAMM